MNYRQLYNLFEEKKSKLSKVIEGYNEEIRFYEDILRSEEKDQEDIKDTLWRNLDINEDNPDLDLESVLNSVNDLIDSPLRKSKALLVSKDLERKDVLERSNALGDLDELRSNIYSEIENGSKLEKEYTKLNKALDASEVIHLISVSLKEQNLTQKQFDAAKNSSAFGRFFSPLKKEVFDKQKLLEEEINGSLFEELKSKKVDDYEDIIEFLEEKSSQLLELGENHNKSLEDRGIAESLYLRKENYLEQEKKLQPHNILKELKNEILKELQETNQLEMLMKNKGMVKEYKSFSESAVKTKVMEELKESLGAKRNDVKKVITDLSKNDRKLRRAKSKAGSKRVKNFNENDFNNSIDQILELNENAIRWSNTRRHRINDSSLDDVSYVLLLNMMFTSDVNADIDSNIENAGAFLMQDTINNIDLNSIDVPNVSIDNISIPNVSVDISIPSVPDVSTTTFASSNDIGGF